MMDQAKGSAQNIAGKVQDAFGGATGDTATQAEGKVRQAAGKLQQTYGETIDNLRDAASSNPVATLAVVASVAFVLGALWGSRD